MRIPLPACYFSEDQYKNHLVIDGVQRITTIKNFLNDKFRLEGLTTFTQHNGLLFSELPQEIQSDIENYTIRCIILRNDNPPGLVQDIFARLNEGSVILADQEIRHALYHGPLNDLLGELGKIPVIENFGRGKSGTQVKDSLEAEAQVLRFFAFSENLKNYEDNLKTFLDNYMRENQHISLVEVDKKRVLFNTTLEKCITIFGDNAFVDTTKAKPKQSLVYFDLLMTDFSFRTTDFLINNKSEIIEAFKHYCNLGAVKKTISGGTLNKSKILKRNELWKSLMSEI